MDQDIVVVIDPEDQEFPLPADQLPVLPLVEPDQVHNPQLNSPNQPLDIPMEGENQQNQAEEPKQVPNLPPNQEPNQEADQPPNQPNQPSQPKQPPNPPPNLPALMANQQQLNWSYFKPEFSGKPEDAEAHLLWTNDWMETHNLPANQKVRRFCLTVTAEARLWYETLGTAQLDWAALQDHFQQQYSKFGNTREQYFHAWQSFQYDENTDTIDSYIHRVKQVVALLNDREPQILELFKNTLPSQLYYMLYHINDLRVTVETAKRLLMKEQIDKQKSGQSSASPFMKAGKENTKKK